MYESDSTERHHEYYDHLDDARRCFHCNDPRYHHYQKVIRYPFPFDFYRCECGLVKQIPIPNKKFFDWFFDSDLFLSSKNSNVRELWGYYDYLADEHLRIKTSQKRYQILRQYFNSDQPLKILKIGPTTGTLLHLLQNEGHECMGCDASSRFIDYAKSKYNVRIDHGRFEQINYANQSFDVILLFNVIENIYNLDEFLKTVESKLKPGGKFILNFVDMTHNWIAKLQKNRYFLYRPPVCYIFTYCVLKSVLLKYGFTIVESLPDMRHLSLEKILALLGKYNLLKISQLMKLNKISFNVYAYPSRILVGQKEQ